MLMINMFMKDPLANSLAVIVLIALVLCWIASLSIILKDTRVDAAQSWHNKLQPVFAFLGLPAALDLIQTRGLTLALATVATLVLILNLVIPILRLTRKSAHPLVVDWNKWAVPFLVAAGLAVAGYLAFVEAANASPSCGPVGDCGAVQNSKYAILFGVLPIGILGLAGYFAILSAWLVRQFGPASLNKWSDLAIWGFCIFGVLFSAYLTFLEPFVIGATCMWCITSAVLMILLLWVTTPAAQQALTIPEDD
jgi:uncharacterized membrane protein